jgi:hypothetical protein
MPEDQTMPLQSLLSPPFDCAQGMLYKREERCTKSLCKDEEIASCLAATRNDDMNHNMLTFRPRVLAQGMLFNSSTF